MNAPTTTPDKGADTKEPENITVDPVEPKDIERAAELQVAQQAVPLNTSADAVLAYLRDQIDEDTLRQVVSRYGRISYTWMMSDQMRVYGKELPEDLIFDKPAPVKSQEKFLESVQEKKDQRKEAMEKALKDSDDPLEKRALEADLERFYPKSKAAKK